MKQFYPYRSRTAYRKGLFVGFLGGIIVGAILGAIATSVNLTH